MVMEVVVMRRGGNIGSNGNGGDGSGGEKKVW